MPANQVRTALLVGLGRSPVRLPLVAADVDIMIPAYGDGPLLRETVQSVLAQTDRDWQLAVIDDAASLEDGSLPAWLWSLDDSRMRYLANPKRLGINRNFQRCADESRADWVIVLGADDRLLPDCLARVRAVISDFGKASWIHSGATIIDNDGRPSLPMADRVKRRSAPKVRGRRLMAGEDLAVSLLRGNWMYLPSCVFRRDVLLHHGFRPGHDIVLDLDLYLRILLSGGSCVLLERPGIEYRRHSASLSSTGADNGTRFAEENAYFHEMAAVMTRAGWPRAASAARRHWTSRMHTAVKVPSLIAARRHRAAAAMVRLAFNPAGPRSSMPISGASSNDTLGSD